VAGETVVAPATSGSVGSAAAGGRRDRSQRGLAALFAQPPARLVRGPARAVVALLVVALAAASLLRQRGAPAWDTVWAEDGAQFLQRASELGVAEALGLTYAGYLHVVPRLVAELAAAVPIEWSAVVLAGSAALISAACGAVVVAASGGLVRAPAVRLALGGLVVLAPVAAPETLNSVALSQWHLTVAAVWAALWVPRSRAGRAVCAATLAAAALSAPLSLITAPLLAVRLAAVRGRAAAWVPAAGLAAQAIQLGALLTSPGGASGGASSPAATLEAYGQRVVTHGLLGFTITDALWPAIGTALVTACCVAAAAVLVAGAAAQRRCALPIAVLAALSLTAFAASVSLRGVVPAMAWTPEIAIGSGSRYAYVPALLLLGAVGIAVDALLRRGRRVVPALVLVVALPGVLLDLPVETVRSRGPRWSDAVHAAETTCSAPDAPERVRLAHPPQQTGQDWGTTLPCRALVDDP